MSATYLLLVLASTIFFIIITGTYFKWHPLFSLLIATLGFGLLAGMNAKTVIETLGQGFGSLIGSIGLIVVLGSILGTVLEESGSVQALGRSLVAHSNSRPSLRIAFLGMLLGIPVFCDSGFIILVSLTKSLAVSSGTAMQTMTLGLAGGLYTTHTMVPPTPGPIAAAANVGAQESLGLVMLLGIIVSIPVVLVAHAYAKFIGPKLSWKVTDTVSTEPISENSSPRKAIVLIILPVFLIATASLLELWKLSGQWADVFIFFGKPLVALLLTVVIALLFFKDENKSMIWIDKGIRQAGPIILLTGCGGALGAVLKASPLAEVISEWVQGQALAGAGFLLMGFLIAALFKSAQGSTTSAMILVSALLSPLAFQAGLTSPMQLSLLVLAIGAGAMIVSHANDSYFWVVSQFSGLSLKEAYKGMTVMTFLQGTSALAIVLLLYFFFA
jgi:GntP family gluconate:H+ symporter